MRHHRIETVPAKLGHKGQRYDAFYESELLVEGSLDPSSDAARALIELGVDLDDKILIYRQGEHELRMHGTVGAFAATRAAEDQSSGPRFVTWHPYLGPVAEKGNEDEGED